MSIAKDTSTGEIIHGHELRALDPNDISNTEYICPYAPCQIPATPCSYRPQNKKSSYFRYYDEHKPKCGIHEANKTAGESDNKSEESLIKGTLPTPYISKLNLTVVRKECEEEGSTISSTSNTEAKADKNTSTEASQESRNGSSTGSIKAIVDFYQSNPDAHQHLKLSLPESGLRSYKEHFSYVNSNGDSEKKIFFGQLNSFTKIDTSKDIIELKFLAKDKKTGRPLKLIINLSQWKNGQRSVFEKEYSEESELAQKYFKTHRDKKIEKYLWAFVFAEVNERNPGTLYTDNFKLVYLKFMKNPYLPTSKTQKCYATKTDPKASNYRSNKVLDHSSAISLEMNNAVNPECNDPFLPESRPEDFNMIYVPKTEVGDTGDHSSDSEFVEIEDVASIQDTELQDNQNNTGDSETAQEKTESHKPPVIKKSVIEKIMSLLFKK